MGGWIVQGGSCFGGAVLHDVVTVVVTVVLVIFGGHAGRVMVLTLVVVLVTRLGLTVTVFVRVVDGCCWNKNQYLPGRMEGFEEGERSPGFRWAASVNLQLSASLGAVWLE